MEARSRGHASPLATNGQSPSSGSPSPVVPLSAVPTASSSPGTPQPAPQPPLQAPSACPGPPSASEAPPAPAQPLVPAAPPRRSVISRLFGISPAAEVAPSPPGRPQEQPSGGGHRHPKRGAALSRWPREPLPTRTGPPFFLRGRQPHSLATRHPACGPAWDGPGWAGRWARVGACCPQSRPQLQRPRQESRTWRTLFLTTVLTAASWRTQPPRRMKRKLEPRPRRTVTG